MQKPAADAQAAGFALFMKLCVGGAHHAFSFSGSRSLAQRLDDRIAEGRNVVRSPAEDELAVGYNLLIDPVCACVLQIGFERWPRGDSLAAQGARFKQGPWPVTDRRNSFSGRNELTDE